MNIKIYSEFLFLHFLKDTHSRYSFKTKGEANEIFSLQLLDLNLLHLILSEEKRISEMHFKEDHESLHANCNLVSAVK